MKTAAKTAAYKLFDADGWLLATYETKAEARDALRALKAEDPAYKNAFIKEVPANG